MSQSNDLHEGAGETSVLKPKGNFERRPHRGWIYFIRSSDAIKIGFSRNVADRLAAHQTSNADSLELLATFRGTRADEADIHLKFCHLRLNGEWFQPDEELLSYIDGIVMEGERKAERPKPSSKTLVAIIGLMRKRSVCGANSPLGYRYSNLITQLRNYEHASNRADLAVKIAGSMADIERLGKAA